MAKFGALDNSIHGDFSKDDFRKRLEEQGFLCFWCGIPIVIDSADSAREATPDHLIPRSIVHVDYIWNIIASCAECNWIRGNKLPGQFLRERWAFAQLVGDIAQKPTTIPFSRERVKEVELDEDGHLVTSHMEVSPFTATVIRHLSTSARMEASPAERLAARRKLLTDQMETIKRLRLVSAGQLELPFEKSKPVSSALIPSDVAALVVAHGLHVTEPHRRKA